MGGVDGVEMLMGECAIVEVIGEIGENHVSPKRAIP